MMKRKNWQARLILALLSVLIIFSGCKTAPASTPGAEAQAALAVLVPPLPVTPVMEPVRFEDRDSGLWLSYDNYRALERNVIAMREYISRLEIIINFYREE